MTAAELGSTEGAHHGFFKVPVRRLEDDPVLQKWIVAKRITWMILLAGAFLFYYLIERLYTALSMLR